MCLNEPDTFAFKSYTKEINICLNEKKAENVEYLRETQSLFFFERLMNMTKIIPTNDLPTKLFFMSLQKLFLYIFIYVLIMCLQFDIHQSHVSPYLPPFKIVFFVCCLTIWSYQIHMRNWQNKLLVHTGV